METPTLERTFRGHKSAVTSVSFHPNMQQLASASMDCSVMVWNFRPQLRAFRFVGHKGPVYDVNFSPQGDLLASSSQDRTVRLWTPTVKGNSVTIKAHAGAIRSVSFSYCAKELLTASDDMHRSAVSCSVAFKFSDFHRNAFVKLAPVCTAANQDPRRMGDLFLESYRMIISVMEKRYRSDRHGCPLCPRCLW